MVIFHKFFPFYKCFLSHKQFLSHKDFPQRQRFKKTFKKNTLKISYECIQNTKTKINSYNNKSPEKERKCISPKIKSPMNSESLSNNILNVTTLSLNKNKIKNVEHKTNLQSHTKTMKREPQKIIQHRKLSKKNKYHMEHLYKLLLYTLKWLFTMPEWKTWNNWKTKVTTYQKKKQQQQKNQKKPNNVLPLFDYLYWLLISTGIVHCIIAFKMKMLFSGFRYVTFI